MKRQWTRRDFIRLAGAGTGAAILAACGATPAPTVAPTAATQAEATAAPTAAAAEATAPPATSAEKAHIIAVDTGDGAALTSTFKPFIEKNPNIEVEVIGVAWDGFDEKVDLLVAGGDPPAIWRPGAKRGYRYYADKGFFPDIGPLVERDNYDVSDFVETVFDFAKWEGKLRGFPSAHYLSTMYYNKTIYESAGVALPPSSWDDKDWTWDKLLADALKITKRGDDPMTTVYGCGDIFDGRHSAWIFGGDYFPDEGYVTGKPDRTVVNSPEVVDGWQYMQDLIYKDQVRPTPAEGEIVSAAGVDLFLSGKMGIVFNANWQFPTYGEIEEFQWSMAPVPAGGKARKTTLYPDQWLMFKDQKFADAAWEALKFLGSADGMRGYYMATDKAGGIPSRKSMASEFVDLAVKTTKLDATTIDDVINKGISVGGKVTASHAILRFAEIYDVAIGPQLDNLWLNKTTPQEAAATMEPKIMEILES